MEPFETTEQLLNNLAQARVTVLIESLNSTYMSAQVTLSRDTNKVVGNGSTACKALNEAYEQGVLAGWLSYV